MVVNRQSRTRKMSGLDKTLYDVFIDAKFSDNSDEDKDYNYKLSEFRVRKKYQRKKCALVNVELLRADLEKVGGA